MWPRVLLVFVVSTPSYHAVVLRWSMPHGHAVSLHHGHTAAVSVQKVVRGHLGRQTALDVLWQSIERQEKEREARQLEQLEQGFELLAHVADERKKFEQQILDRSNHFQKHQSTDAEAAICIQRYFRRHKNYIQMCTCAKPASKLRAEAVKREERALSLVCMLRVLLESEAGPVKGGHQEFEMICENNGGARSTLTVDAMLKVLTKVGLSEVLEESDVKILHQHVNGHYPTLLSFLKEGNVDRVEAEIRLLIHTVETNQTANIDDVFMFFDKDGNGSISKSEFKEALEQLNFDTELRDRELELLTQRFSTSTSTRTHGNNSGTSGGLPDASIDYSDFLDHFGSDHDFVKAQSIMADIASYWKQLVSMSDHKSRNKVSLSHSMSVHSPLHLESVLDSHKVHTPKFGQRGFGRRSVHMRAEQIAEFSQPPEDQWWSDSAATSEAGDRATDEEERRQRAETELSFENHTASLSSPSTGTSLTTPRASPSSSPSLRFNNVPTPEVNTTTDSTKFQHDRSLSPSTMELSNAMEEMEERLTVQMERAMRYNEAAKIAAEKNATAAAVTMHEQAMEAAKRAAEEVVRTSSRSNDRQRAAGGQSSSVAASISQSDVDRALHQTRTEMALELKAELESSQAKLYQELKQMKDENTKQHKENEKNHSHSNPLHYRRHRHHPKSNFDPDNNDTSTGEWEDEEGSESGGEADRHARMQRKHDVEIKSVHHTLQSLETRSKETQAKEKQLDRSFFELQRQITHLEVEQKQLERVSMKRLSQSEELLEQSTKVVTRDEHIISIEKVKSVESVNEKLRKDMERLQEQVKRLEQERVVAMSPRITRASQNRLGSPVHTVQSSDLVVKEDLAKLAALAYHVVETGGENKEMLVDQVAAILGTTSFERLDKSLESKRSPLRGDKKLAPMSHDAHAALLASARENLSAATATTTATATTSKKGLKESTTESMVSMVPRETAARSQSSKKKKRRRVKRVAISARKYDVEEFHPDSAWNAPSPNQRKVSPMYDHKSLNIGGVSHRNIAGTPQPRKATTITARGVEVRSRPASAPRRRRAPRSTRAGGPADKHAVKLSATESIANGRNQVSKESKRLGDEDRRTRRAAASKHAPTGVHATRAQIHKLKQRLMRTIVANRLFSENELNFVFENAIELSPFDRLEMTIMIDELKDELGLSNPVAYEDGVVNRSGSPSYYESDQGNLKSEIRGRSRPPGTKTYHHDLA